ncbi:helix-turn-helix domain-containing protein [Sphingobacterium psychroaquaticum]|uniref:AraC-type DNA-binding protein n=1 Tax=Sphingobacterium psychroaquaticum TaxID=561061 RepID=A0A1X7KDM4_9SPHI|nr:helix-turn-helix domain-containing protein [Sphingobacterium psychroaquaticum]QBQ42899.1 AraC family transcriptional regulator [Sphingobacterium psychroaquaticum]SMG38980.1 AraC-type DNA-binding protein [Sphingobacterium psychroaquaticum]
MKSAIKIISNYEYKKLFLPDVSDHTLFNESKIQVYRIENYLRSILMPVVPYRTTFNFLIFVTKGSLTQHLESGSYTLTAQQAINIKQGNITATLSLSDDIEGFFVVYENEIVTDIALGINDIKFFNSNPFITLKPHVAEWVKRILLLLEDELYTEGKQMDICVSLLQSALLKIIRTDIETRAPMSRQLDIAFRFRELVQRFHIDHKNVLFYANLLHISENYLNKCVKEATNKPPKQWINEISILHSQILLQDATRDIAGIAFELKYQSPSYFTRLFKKITGYSPSDYRKHKFLS